MNNALAVTNERHEMQYREDGWFNATSAALRFGKAPNDWLMLLGTAEYVCALADSLTGDSRWSKEISEFNILYEKRIASAVAKAKLLKLIKSTKLVATKQGGADIGGGTWLHPKLAVPFARWLDVRFAVWCDQQINKIIQGESNQDWGKLRHEASATFQAMFEVLQKAREKDGKTTTDLDYMNEVKLISDVTMGSYTGQNRNCLTAAERDVVVYLELQNAVLIARGIDYEDRKEELTKIHQAYIDKQQKRLAARKPKQIKAIKV